MPPKQNSFLQTSDAQNARQNAIHMRMPYTSKNAIRMPDSQKKNAIRMAFSVYGILIVWHFVWHFFGIFENLCLFKQYQSGISWKQVYLGSLTVLAPGQLYTFPSTNVQNDQIPKNSSLELVGMLRLESKFSKGIHHFSKGSHHFSKGNLNRISQILSHMIWLSGQFGILFSPTGWFFPEIFRDFWVPLLKHTKTSCWLVVFLVGWLHPFEEY